MEVRGLYHRKGDIYALYQEDNLSIVRYSLAMDPVIRSLKKEFGRSSGAPIYYEEPRPFFEARRRGVKVRTASRKVTKNFVDNFINNFLLRYETKLSVKEYVQTYYGFNPGIENEETIHETIALEQLIRTNRELFDLPEEGVFYMETPFYNAFNQFWEKGDVVNFMNQRKVQTKLRNPNNPLTAVDLVYLADNKVHAIEIKIGCGSNPGRARRQLKVAGRYLLRNWDVNVQLMLVQKGSEPSLIKVEHHVIKEGELKDISHEVLDISSIGS